MIGRDELADRLSQHGANGVCRTRDRKHQQREPVHSRDSKPCCRDAKHCDRGNDQSSLPLKTSDTRHHEGSQHGSDRRRRREKTVATRADMQTFLGEDWQ